MSDGSKPEPIESSLLDLHLGRLDADQARQVQEALSASPELADKNRVLGEVLSLLDAYDAPDPPENLTDAVMAKIDEQTAVLPFKRAASAMPAATAQDVSATPVLSLRELIAIAACITLFVGIFVPGYFKARNIVARNRCREHLRQMWGGMALYAEANDGYAPYAGYVMGGSWLPTRTPRVRRVSNTQPVFKLLRGDYVRDPGVFICPATAHGRPMLAANYREFTDFAEPANITYSFMFMNLPQGRRLDEMNAMMVLMADLNPLFDSRARGHILDPYDENAPNSLAHEQGAGQNVVYVGGRIGWFTRPTIGVNRDNIYRAGKLTRYQGTETPTSPTDTMLIP